MKCFRCGAPKVEFHHPTLRDPAGARLDPLLIVPLCHDCHCADHDVLRVLDLEDAGGMRSSLVERVELRLRRLAVFAYRMAREDSGSFWARLADAVAGWARELRRHIDRLDAGLPGWREVEPDL